MTIVGNAVELAGMMPEMSKLNITMESRMVISEKRILVQRVERTQSTMPYARLIFRRCPVEEESQAAS